MSQAAERRVTPGVRVVQLKHSVLRQVAPSEAAHWTAEVIVVMPWVNASRAPTSARLLAQRAGMAMLILAVQDDTSSGPVALWNDAIARVECRWFGYVADDAFPGRYWMRNAMTTLARLPHACLLAFNDGKWFGELAGFGLVRRDWVRKLYADHLFHPGYRQHYGDTELTLIARQQGALAYDPHAMLVEIDPLKDRRAVDAQDRALFLRRQEEGFDGLVTDPNLLRIFQ